MSERARAATHVPAVNATDLSAIRVTLKRAQVCAGVHLDAA